MNSSALTAADQPQDSDVSIQMVDIMGDYQEPEQGTMTGVLHFVSLPSFITDLIAVRRAQ